MNIDKILVPTDLSDASTKAIDYALSLADVTDARITLLHVTPRPIDYLPLDEWIFGDESDAHDLGTRVREAAAEALETYAAKLPAAIRERLELETVLGVPSQVIVERASDGYDLVVMSTHGRTGVKHVMLGSVAERVVRLAPCPVLTVR
jgi:nucleotide-binding universal stress UspA family protein